MEQFRFEILSQKEMNVEKLKQYVRNIPDFPIQGIQFKDVTTLFKEPEILKELSDELYEMYRNAGITKVVGIESRGFILGPLLAERLFAGFVPIRKPGKLPAATYEISYEKEYGTDTIQIHQDALNEKDIVLLHDDLLATGGTMKAAVDSIREKTKELDNIEIEIVKFLTNCNRVSRLKDEAKQYKVELPVSSKYAGCEEWEQAIKKNNKIYEAIQLEQCKEEVVVAVKKPEPPVPCDLISKKLDAANNQLRLLLLQIRTKKGDTATILEEYESIKASVNSVYVPAFNTKCATKKDKDVYKAYKGWCANIDEELLK